MDRFVLFILLKQELGWKSGLQTLCWDGGLDGNVSNFQFYQRRVGSGSLLHEVTLLQTSKQDTKENKLMSI
jgi:hypothetical protein